MERYRYDAYGGCTVLDADGSDDSDGVNDGQMAGPGAAS